MSCFGSRSVVPIDEFSYHVAIAIQSRRNDQEYFNKDFVPYVSTHAQRLGYVVDISTKAGREFTLEALSKVLNADNQDTIKRRDVRFMADNFNLIELLENIKSIKQGVSEGKVMKN